MCSLLHIAQHTCIEQQTYAQSSATIHMRTLIAATARLFSPAIRIQESNLLFSFFSFALLSLHATYLYGMLKIWFVHNDVSERRARREHANDWTRDDCLILNSSKCIALPWIFIRKIHISVGRLLLRKIVRFNCAVCVGNVDQRNGNEQEKRTICRRHFEVRDKTNEEWISQAKGALQEKKMSRKKIIHCFRYGNFQTNRINFAEVLLCFSILRRFIILINAFLLVLMPHLFHFVSVYPKFQYFHSFYLLSLWEVSSLASGRAKENL